MNRNNTLAGIFVLGSLALAVAIAFVLGDALDKFGSKHEYTVRFPTTVGVAGLQPGAEITFAGLPVGRVLSIEPHYPGGEDNAASAMDVLIAVDARITLYEDALADLSPPLLGGVSTINFASAGTGTIPANETDTKLARNNADGRLDAGETLRGRFAPSILAQLGFSVEDAERIRNAIADVEATTAKARELTAWFGDRAIEAEPNISGAITEARAAVEDVRGFTRRFSAEDGWGPQIDTILRDTGATVAQGPLVAQDVRDAIASGRDLIDTNKPTIERIMANVEATTERVRFETMDQAEELISRGTLAVTSYRELAENADSLVTSARPDIGITLTNARGISQQARLFLDEIRAQPWRLLKQPGKAELEREPLYAAARAYASAVGDLRAASEALDEAVSSGNPDAAEQIARIAQAVQAAYEDYGQAERALLKTLSAETP
ncbi:MAG: MlaD family protein [Phycisphaerales bacterium]